ncbi:PilZ domain-containing protein [Vulgatibacter incomptus]|uniref:Response regulator receiver protein n=1 Tax=Vulgatibacter incomptus TaxID=1391653 RepID=A0A0K1PFN5_9BACT|nr:PilZ domain-containing protein [Vulgatibacter incomptus]AKU92221.1 response regulator receiver protein [Vulgatibacter incomptus]
MEPSPSLSPAVLVCGAVAWRIDQLESALERIRASLPADALYRITLGHRPREDLLVLVLEPGSSTNPRFAAIALEAAGLGGLRALDIAASVKPDAIRERALKGCDPVLEVDDPKQTVAKLRAALGRGPSASTGRTEKATVRFDSAESFLEAWTRELSNGTIFVPCTGRAPEPSASVALELMVPGDPAPVRALGTVLRRRDGGFEARVALADAARSRLESSVKRLCAGESKELRHEGRLPIRLPARLSLAGGNVVAAWTRDLSRGGAFVQIEAPPALGTAVEVSIELPGGELLRAPSQVVRVVGPAEASARGRPAGCGLSFGELSPGDREKLEAFVDATELRPNARVLLVDDVALFRRILGDELASRGCEVLEAENGADAFDRLVDELFTLDLLILDLVLPNTSGVELLHRIRQLGGESDLKIAVVAGSVDNPGVRSRILAAGANEVLPKSLPAPEIADRLLGLLRS